MAAGSGASIPLSGALGRNTVEKLALESGVLLTGFGMRSGIGTTTAMTP